MTLGPFQQDKSYTKESKYKEGRRCDTEIFLEKVAVLLFSYLPEILPEFDRRKYDKDYL